MAIWQFSLFLIPNASLKERFLQTPSRLPMDVAEDTLWWADHQPVQGFEHAVSDILPESLSWSHSMRIWGAERSNSILICYLTKERREVEQIEIRIDVSHFLPDFVSQACRWAASLDCVARTKAYEVVQPDYLTVKNAITTSRASQFLEDPEATLRSLPKDEFERKD